MSVNQTNSTTPTDSILGEDLFRVDGNQTGIDYHFAFDFNNSGYIDLNDWLYPQGNLGSSSWVTDDILREIRSNFFMHKETPTAVLIALYTISFCMGLFGNCLVIYIFARKRHMRTITNSFLVNLACCDLLVVCLCMPFSVAMEIYANWVYGDVMCRVVNFGQGLSVSSSILTLAVISAERFYAIRRPLRARAFISRTRIHRIIFSLWILAALAACPSLFVRKETLVEKIFNVTISTCVEEWNTKSLKHTYNFALLILLYLTPVSFICIGYLQIGLNLWRTDSMLHAGSSAAESANARTNLAGRRKVAKMLFVMALLFAVSWLPIQLLGIILDFLPESVLLQHGIILRHVHSYFLWLGHTNSSINPLCYCIMSTSFKAAIKVEFRHCCCGRIELARESFKSMSMSVSITTGNGQHTFHARRGSATRLGYLPVGYSTTSSSAPAQASEHKRDQCRNPDLLQHVPMLENRV